MRFHPPNRRPRRLVWYPPPGDSTSKRRLDYRDQRAGRFAGTGQISFLLYPRGLIANAIAAAGQSDNQPEGYLAKIEANNPLPGDICPGARYVVSMTGGTMARIGETIKSPNALSH